MNLFKIEGLYIKSNSKSYYKVVKERSDVLTSCRYGTLQYKIGEWTKAPEGTKLFVFDSFDAANSFAQSNDTIYSCDVRGVEDGLACLYEDYIETFWKAVNEQDYKMLSYLAKTNEIFSMEHAKWTSEVQLLSKVVHSKIY